MSHHAADDRRYWDAALETQPRADWDALKLALLQDHLRLAYAQSPFYRQHFDAAGVRPAPLSVHP